eukprot:TRINITY_DN55759_c0_g1_i1.p1 TRINITY_DN55759_c0_g1~~TRINITY_DN55759_c0_g1_i1.p1  ORF type:complete len:603 (-),score=83.93 TRINITY_DN55759_c0_g1_i1:115-1923(-)
MRAVAAANAAKAAAELGENLTEPLATPVKGGRDISRTRRPWVKGVRSSNRQQAGRNSKPPTSDQRDTADIRQAATQTAAAKNALAASSASHATPSPSAVAASLTNARPTSESSSGGGGGGGTPSKTRRLPWEYPEAWLGPPGTQSTIAKRTAPHVPAALPPLHARRIRRGYYRSHEQKSAAEARVNPEPLRVEEVETSTRAPESRQAIAWREGGNGPIASGGGEIAAGNAGSCVSAAAAACRAIVNEAEDSKVSPTSSTRTGLTQEDHSDVCSESPTLCFVASREPKRGRRGSFTRSDPTMLSVHSVQNSPVSPAVGAVNVKTAWHKMGTPQRKSSRPVSPAFVGETSIAESTVVSSPVTPSRYSPVRVASPLSPSPTAASSPAANCVRATIAAATQAVSDDPTIVAVVHAADSLKNSDAVAAPDVTGERDRRIMQRAAPPSLTLPKDIAQEKKNRKLRFSDDDDLFEAFTPYSRVYGAHPSNFYFDDAGMMVSADTMQIDLGDADEGSVLECVATCGVGYRTSPRMSARFDDMQSVHFGDRFRVIERSGRWVRNDVGWLPLFINCVAVFEVASVRGSRHSADSLGTPRCCIMVDTAEEVTR